MNEIEKSLLKQVAELDALPVGAYNIRTNGKSAARNSSANIEIVTKEDKPGIDIIIKPGTKNESVHIPVVVSESGLKDMVYNDFYIGEGADVTIIAGCGISNCGDEDSSHDGIHAFHLEKDSRVRYIEKHYGEGNGRGKRFMNPTTEVYMEEDSFMNMETSQIAGIDDTERITVARLKKGASLTIHDSLMTTGQQNAVAKMTVDMDEEGAKADIISRGVARDDSRQEVTISLSGNAPCSGHAECDSIIMDRGIIVATPALTAKHVDAQLIHEAAIGKIAGDQLMKLMSLGLSEAEAEEMIIKGFLS